MAIKRPYQLAILGSGAMGQALCCGLLRADLFSAENVICADIDEDKLARLRDETGVNTTKSNIDAVKSAENIMLSVKPFMIDAVLDEISSVLSTDQLVISIAAGVTIEHIMKRLPEGTPVVRAMPNTPSLVGLGATGFCLSANARPQDAELAKSIFNAVGQVVEVPEKLIDAVTGLSGSGPAYVYLMIESMMEAGVSVGLTRDAALLLSAQTVLGAAKMVLETGAQPAELRSMVTTPGGTTIAGLAAMERGSFRATIIDAVQAATKRAQELSQPEKKGGGTK